MVNVFFLFLLVCPVFLLSFLQFYFLINISLFPFFLVYFFNFSSSCFSQNFIFFGCFYCFCLVFLVSSGSYLSSTTLKFLFLFLQFQFFVFVFFFTYVMVSLSLTHFFYYYFIQLTKNPAYGRHQLSRPMRIVGPIQI